MGARLELKDIVRTYMRGDQEVPVLLGINLTIAAGERIAIMGRSGSGKSTLLNLIGCLDVPSSGAYFFDDRDVARFDDDALSALRCKSIGFIFQQFHLLAGMTIVENVALPMEYARVSPREQVARAEELLTMVGLGHRLRHKPLELSGGERQRVAIARALANRPQLLLADEPTASLDKENEETVTDLLLRAVREDGVTLVVATHDSRLADRADRVVQLVDGLIVD
jgi:putative ABC transport system ATP-binding protein